MNKCGVVVLLAVACTGSEGEMGEMGEMGSPGESVQARPEPAGANCPAGGVALISAAGTTYVCNGTNGATGASGSNGTNGTNGVDATAPSGAIIAFAGPNAPAGYLPCDGAAVSRTTFPSLFAAIGVTYGVGDGINTFNVPDARGVFLRGEGAQTIGGVTYTAAAKGTLQGDAFRSHNHGGGNHAHSSGTIDIPGGAFNPNGSYLGRASHSNNAAGTVNNSGAIIGTEGGSETRPANLVVTYYIKI